MGFTLTINATVAAQNSEWLLPNSRLGYGFILPHSIPDGQAMGGAFNALATDRGINYMNPASYTSLGFSHLQFGFENWSLRQSRGDDRQTGNQTFINQVALGFGRKNFGMSFGIRPISFVDYNFTNNIQVQDSDTLVNIGKNYTGNGGFNKIYFGAAYKIGKLSWGANANFIFGTIERNTNILYPSNFNALNTRRRDLFTASAFLFDFGAQYVTKIKKLDIVLGATYRPAQRIMGLRQSIAQTYTTGTFDNIKDEFEIVPENRDFILDAGYLGGGIAVGKMNKWKVIVDFQYLPYKNFKVFGEPDLNYTNGYRASLGAEIFGNVLTKSGKSDFNSTIYRLGTYFSNPIIHPNGVPYSEIGITFGLGLPIFRNNETRRNLRSYLNMSVEAGSRIPENSNLIRENFVRLNFVFSIRDEWFQQLKFK